MILGHDDEEPQIQQSGLEIMLNLIKNLPVELVGTNVLGYLTIRDIVMLEQACGSKNSYQQFLYWVPYSSPVVLPSRNHKSTITLNWFAKRLCRIRSLTIELPGDNPDLHVKNLQVNNFDLQIHFGTTTEKLKPLLANNMGFKVRNIDITGNQNRDVIEQLSACTSNVEQLRISHSGNCMDWLTADILSRWRRLKEIELKEEAVTTLLISSIVQTCSELTSIKLYSITVDDAAVFQIAQHYPKLEILQLMTSNITWTSLLALSEKRLPLKVLDVPCIPNIPTADIAKRCSHALSRIRYLNTGDFNRNGQDVTILIPYITGLTSVAVRYYNDTYIPLLTQHCHKLTKIAVNDIACSVSDILSLCCANPLLEDLRYFPYGGITDTILIELILVCPHLHTLWLPNETDITDIGILALSEHCPQLRQLTLYNCDQVTEAVVLQLLQRCRKLTRLWVSSSSLSEETWTQLDKNTQKRVSRC